MNRIARNADKGGIILYDIDGAEAGYSEDDECFNSHQIHISRALSDEEAIILDFLNGEDCGCFCDEGALEIDGKAADMAWIDAGPLSLQAIGYLLALRA